MARLNIDSSGLILLEIPDAKGDSHSYSVNPAPTDLDPKYWSVLVKRLDSEDEYLVAVGSSHRWTCGCKDFQFRAKGQPYQCKHIKDMKCIKAAIDRLMPATQPAETQEIAS